MAAFNHSIGNKAMRSTNQPWYGIYKHRGQYWYATAHTGLGSVVGTNGEYSLDCFTNGVDDLPIQ